MDIFKQGMKGPSRPAPVVPGLVNRYSPVTNWNDDPFGAHVFEPNPQFAQKKKPPPRPPPPKFNKQPDIPHKPTHFIRRPTVLSNLLSRKSKNTTTSESVSMNYNYSANQQTFLTDCGNDLDAHRLFPKCEPKNSQTGALIDLSSPPSSPTFTTRSSSDGLSVDSFGSDATTSTNHHNHNNGNISQAESGFEDDFDLYMTRSTKKISKDDTLDNFTMVDPFSPLTVTKPPIMKKPVFSKDLFEMGNAPVVAPLKGPTIIRAKPARPKPPDNSALLKNTFGNSFPVMTMNVNTTTPIQKIGNSFGDSYDSKSLSWDDSPSRSRESSPPMPSIPPPPPPVLVDEDLPVPEVSWDNDPTDSDEEEPYAIALFDYFTDHPDDLCFSTNSRIKLLRREDSDWLFGSLRTGAQGLFPSNYVEIKVPLPTENLSSKASFATALYDFEPDQPGDLRFKAGDSIRVLNKINEEWYLGECNSIRGQFPVNYVQMS